VILGFLDLVNFLKTLRLLDSSLYTPNETLVG
jgi:hypothetical protein